MNLKWLFFFVWVGCLIAFLVGQKSAPPDYATVPNSPWGNLFGISFALGGISFVAMFIAIMVEKSPKTDSSKQERKPAPVKRQSTKKDLTFGYVVFMLFVAGLLSLLFGIFSLPFLTPADNLTFGEKVSIGDQNMWKIVAVFSVLSVITFSITLLVKTWRLLGVLLLLFSFAGASIVLILDNRNNGSIYTDDTEIITDKTRCVEDYSIKQAKSCTVSIIRDDGAHGTGFSVKKGYLVTNKHVVDGAKKLTTWIDGEKDLTMWNYSPTLDVAILKLPVDIPTCKWFDSSKLSLAETLYAIGWPNDPTGDSTITKGIYSRLNQFEGGLEFVQTDAAINPGNSGGPLVNSCGVVGINTIKEFWSQEQLPRPLEGLGNALSSKTLIPLVTELIVQGKTSEIPKIASKTNAPNSNIPRSTPTINLNDVKNYLAHVREMKNSWGNDNKTFPQDEIRSLLDSLERQIIFSETIISRIEKTGKVSQDDLIMYDQIVKMGNETNALTTKLRNWYYKNR